MALNKEKLKIDIKNMLIILNQYDGSKGKTTKNASDFFSDTLANIIDKYIRSGTVNTNVTGTTSGGTAITGKGIGSLI